MEIIVIGNGPSVLNTNYGSIIDSFPEVVRINHYVPSKDVGYKLTIFAATTINHRFYPEVLTKAREIIIWNENDQFKSSTYDNAIQKVRPDTKNVKDILHTVHNFSRFPRPGFASTGLSILLYLIESKKYKKIHIFGFDNLIKNTQEHYFDDDLVSLLNNHNSDLERKFIEYYVEKGILCRLQDEFTPTP